MDLTRGVSIVIPLRVDNPERAENLRFILSLLLHATADRGISGYS